MLSQLQRIYPRAADVVNGRRGGRQKTQEQFLGAEALESIQNGTKVDLNALGLRDVAFQAITQATTLSKVALTLDGQTYTDDTAPYSLPEMDSADWRLTNGLHTLAVTAYDAAGVASSLSSRSLAVVKGVATTHDASTASSSGKSITHRLP